MICRILYHKRMWNSPWRGRSFERERVGQTEGLRYRTTGEEAFLPARLALQLGLGVADAAADRLGGNRHQPVIVADHKVAGRTSSPPITTGPLMMPRSAEAGPLGRDVAREHRKVGPARERADVADGTVADQAHGTPAPQVRAQDLADHGGLGVAAGGDHQHLAGADPVDGPGARRRSPAARRRR